MAILQLLQLIQTEPPPDTFTPTTTDPESNGEGSTSPTFSADSACAGAGSDNLEDLSSSLLPLVLEVDTSSDAPFLETLNDALLASIELAFTLCLVGANRKLVQKNQRYLSETLLKGAEIAVGPAIVNTSE